MDDPEDLRPDGEALSEDELDTVTGGTLPSGPHDNPLTW